MHCKRYKALSQERNNAQTKFCWRHLYKRGKRGAMHLSGLEEIPKFPKWLEEDVKRVIGVMFPKDGEDSSKLPFL